MPIQQETLNAPGLSAGQQRQIGFSADDSCFLSVAFCFSANFFSFVARIRDMRPHRGFGTIEPSAPLHRPAIFHIAQHQRRALSRCQPLQPGGQPVALFGSEHGRFRRFRMALGRLGDLAKRHPAVTSQKIERGVGRDARQPVRGFQFVFELLLTLQSFDESFLGQILRVMNVSDHAVNLQENAPQIFGDEALLQLPVLQLDGYASRFEQRPALPVVAGGRRIGLFHANLQRKSRHSLEQMTPGSARRGKELARYSQV